MSKKQDKITLERILLDIGGKQTKVELDDPDFYNLFTRGYLIDSPSDTIISGEMCQCHKNSAFLWETAKRRYRIMTGYALSSSGIWHQHTWILDSNDTVIETTVKREKYYGYVLTPLEAETFLWIYKERSSQ